MSETNDPPPPRGRPPITDAHRLEMRTQIADAAKQLFQLEGYGQVSIRRIAGMVGCSPMTLYTYYDAKIDILRALWSDVFKDVFDRLDALNVLAGRAGLQTLASAYLAYWLEHSEHYRLVFMAEGVTQPDVNLFLDDPDLVQRFQIFAVAIAEACPNEISDADMKLKLDALMCFLHGIAHNLITISGYPWSKAPQLVEIAIEGVLGHTHD